MSSVNSKWKVLIIFCKIYLAAAQERADKCSAGELEVQGEASHSINKLKYLNSLTFLIYAHCKEHSGSSTPPTLCNADQHRTMWERRIWWQRRNHDFNSIQELLIELYFFISLYCTHCVHFFWLGHWTSFPGQRCERFSTKRYRQCDFVVLQVPQLYNCDRVTYSLEI